MILNRQRAIRVSIPPLEKFLARVQSRLAARSGDSSRVALVTDARSRVESQLSWQKSKPTDVLSFPADDAQTNLHRAIA